MKLSPPAKQRAGARVGSAAAPGATWMTAAAECEGRRGGDRPGHSWRRAGVGE